MQTSWSVIPHLLITVVEPFSPSQVLPSSWEVSTSYGWPWPPASLFLHHQFTFFFALAQTSLPMTMLVTPNYSISHESISERPLCPPFLPFLFICSSHPLWLLLWPFKVSHSLLSFTSSLLTNTLPNVPCTSLSGCHWKGRHWRARS